MRDFAVTNIANMMLILTKCELAKNSILVAGTAVAVVLCVTKANQIREKKMGGINRSIAPTTKVTFISHVHDN